MPRASVKCPQCGRGYDVDESWLGKKGRCKKCNATFPLTRSGMERVPEAAAEHATRRAEPEATRAVNAGGRRSTSAVEQISQEWRPGDVILDLYEVRRVFESGGMGLVYQVHHRGWNVPLAVKCPRADFFRTEQDKQNFEREAETWVNLGLHPHIVSCHYVRRLGGIPRVFAEYMEGGSLKDWIDSGKLYAGGCDASLERMLDIAIQFAWGLHYAHEQGLIHQDVKPANVLLAEDGTAKVSDFGLAKAQPAPRRGGENRPGSSLLVSTGGMTPAYCSPEQAGQQPLSRRTDVWSWAVSLLEMFTGEVTWHSGVAAAEALEGYLDAGGSGDDGIPLMRSDVAELLRRCFQHDPERRPRDLLAAADTLRAIYAKTTGHANSRHLPEPAKAIAASLNNRAVSLVDLNKLAEAEKLWERVLVLDRQHAESSFNEGLQKWRSGRIDDLQLVQRLREIGNAHPSEWLPLYLLAQVHVERGDCEAAAELLERPTGASQPLVQDLLAWTREHLSTSRRCVRTFEGHTGIVACVSLSGDGRQALSGSYDRTLKLWEVATGRCLRTFEGHTEEVWSVCLSSDGRYALSGGRDHALKLWELSTGKCLRTFEAHTSTVTSVCLWKDGGFALSSSGDKTLKLWEVPTGRCLRTFEGHKFWVNCMCLSGDGRWALSGSQDHTLKLWEVATGRCLRTFEGHEGGVGAVCLSSNGQYALSGSDDCTVRLWDVSTGGCLRVFEGHTGAVKSVCFGREGRYALSGSAALKLWDVSTGRCLRTFEGPWVKAVCVTADGHFALTANHGKTLQLWGLPWSAPTVPFSLCRIVTTEDIRTHGELLQQARLAITRGDYREAVELLRPARAQPGQAREPDTLDVWSALYVRLPRQGLSAGWQQSTFEGHSRYVNSVCLSVDGRYALSGSGDPFGSDDRTMKLWEFATGRCLRTFEGHTDAVKSVSLSADGRFALSGSEDKTLKLWDVSAGNCLRSFDGHKFRVDSVSWSGDGRFALSGSVDKTLKLWEIATGRCLRTFNGHTAFVTSACLSPDGRCALSGATDGTLRLWDVATGRSLRTFEGHSKMVISVCLSEDGRYALSGSADCTVRLWDISTGGCLRVFEGHTGLVASVSLSGDGRQALSGSYDQTLKLWDVFTGHCLRSFEGHTSMVMSACLSGDGRYALSGSADATLKVWQLDWELESRTPADWNAGARAHLETFLTSHTPYATTLPASGTPSDEEITLALTRRGRPEWSESDFEQLLHTLGCAGFGWLRPNGVRRELDKMAADWQGPPPLLG